MYVVAHVYLEYVENVLGQVNPFCTMKFCSDHYYFFKRFYLFIHSFIHSFMRQREREAETQAEGEAGSIQGARYGTRSRVSRIMPWAEGRH